MSSKKHKIQTSSGVFERFYQNYLFKVSNIVISGIITKPRQAVFTTSRKYLSI